MLRVLSLAGHVLALGVPGAGRTKTSVHGRDVPFTGSFSGSSAHNLSTGEFHSVWTGEANHFGISNLEQQAQITVTGPTALSAVGTWTLTGGDGDQLFGTAVGTLVPVDATHMTAVIDYAATGGTGRFTDASGTFTITMHHVRTALENGISYGEQQATLVGHLSW